MIHGKLGGGGMFGTLLLLMDYLISCMVLCVMGNYIQGPHGSLKSLKVFKNMKSMKSL